MKTIQALSLLILTALAVSSCNSDRSLICRKPSGTQNLVEYSVQDFEQLELQMAGDVVLTQGDEFKLEIEAAENIHEILVADVSGSELTLRTERGKCIRGRSDVVFYVTCPTINSITLSGSGSITSDASFQGENLDIRLSGSGKIDLAKMNYNDVFTTISGSGKINMNELEAKSCELKISGSGDIEANNSAFGEVDVNLTGSGKCTVDGEASFLNGNVSGSGKLETDRLATNEVHVKISGSGGAYVFAEEALDVVITGSGNVHYIGEPTINTRITGSGKVVDNN